MNEDWKPTARLRYVKRGGQMVAGPTLLAGPTSSWVPSRILQQWFAADVPSYMRTQSDGEWRDVTVEEETAP